jgi:hypothetical protein
MGDGRSDRASGKWQVQMFVQRYIVYSMAIRTLSCTNSGQDCDESFLAS